MSKRSEKSRVQSVDIFQLLKETADQAEKSRRKDLLAPLDVQEFFSEGNITINNRICEGVECKLCIKACPTNALYWKTGEIGVTRELCVFCGACVLSCIVDDCIRINRKRAPGQVEIFNNPKDFVMLQHMINAKKRCKRVETVSPKLEDYLAQKKSKT